MWALVAMLICGFTLGCFAHIFAEAWHEQHAQREQAKAERRERMKPATFPDRRRNPRMGTDPTRLPQHSRRRRQVRMYGRPAFEQRAS